VQHVLCGRLVLVSHHGGITRPANFHATKEIGLRARHPVETGRLELEPTFEDLCIRVERHAGAALVFHSAFFLELAIWLAAREFLFVSLLVTSNFHEQSVGERVDHRDANPVQTAGGLIGITTEFPARMECGHDDLERGLVFELRMRVNGNAAAIVRDLERSVRHQLHANPTRVTGNCFIHGVIEHFRKQVMQRAFVRAPNIHARAPTNGLQPFKDFNVLGGIADLPGRCLFGHSFRCGFLCTGACLGRAEEIVRGRFALGGSLAGSGFLFCGHRNSKEVGVRDPEPNQTSF